MTRLESYPIQVVAELLVKLREDVTRSPADAGPFELCARSSAARTLELLSWANEHWNDPLVGLLIPCLRPACEDLIVLSYLLQLEQDPDDVIRALLVQNGNEGVAAQKEFFQHVRPWQPILVTPDLFGDESNMFEIGERLGWPKKHGKYSLPSTYRMADDVGLLSIYRYIYKITSNNVHFNPQTLLRMCWEKGSGWESSLSHFSKYYREHLLIYGIYLFIQLAERLTNVLGLSAEEMKEVELATFAIELLPRWPELVTFEECNLSTPNYLEYWASFVASDPKYAEYLKGTEGGDNSDA